MSSTSPDTVALRFGKTVWQIPQSGFASARTQRAPLENLHEAVDSALSQPLDFASIDRMIVPGDTVALAVDPAVPCLSNVVAAIAQWLVEHGTRQESLQVIYPGSEVQTNELKERLQKSGFADIQVIRHDPDDVNSVSYVAADEDAQAIYINRCLVDADVVIPISCARDSGAIDYLGAFSIFPLFSNREIRGQLYCYARLSNPDQHQHLIDRSNQAAWWLGVMVAVQVVPAKDEQVANVLCGLLDTVDTSARGQLSEGKLSDSRLSDGQATEEMEADLVIACLDGNDQDWTNLAKALHAATRYCTTGGTIVLCTELNETVGPALKRLRDGQSSREQIEKRVAKDCTDDALAAGAILEITRDRHVYLVSNHRPGTIESLGMAVLADENQLTHIVRQHASYVVLHAAQHA